MSVLHGDSNESNLMYFKVRAVAALALTLSIVAGVCKADPGTPAQQYSALLKEYRPVSAGMRKAKTDLERKTAVAQIGAYAPRFLELAKKYSKDPIALTALKQAVQAVGTADSAAQITWETNRSEFQVRVRDDAAANTVALVLRDRLTSDKINPILDRMRYGYRMEYAKCLRTVLEKNPHRDVQAMACLSLAQFLNDRLRMLRLTEDRPELAKQYAAVFGKNYLPQLQRIGQAKLAVQVETLFEWAAEDYGDVKIRVGTVGERAKSELYNIRHLSVGKVAPNMAGKDQDGKQFQLSDYRGKVVLLYFWSEF